MKRKLKLTQHEISLMIVILATLNADDYDEGEVKDIILRAKRIVEEAPPIAEEAPPPIRLVPGSGFIPMPFERKHWRKSMERAREELRIIARIKKRS